MTPEDEREAQYADELVALLPQDARDKLLTDWAQYLIDREQTDHIVTSSWGGSPATTRTTCGRD